MSDKGLLFVVSAPAGCGKDTILELMLRKTDSAGYSVSATTRAPREGEIDGVHYRFLTRERFEEMIKEGAVLEYTEYCGNYYGTLRESVDSLLSQGKDAILKIEIEGAMNIKKQFPTAAWCLSCRRPWRSWSAACATEGRRQRIRSRSVWRRLATNLRRRTTTIILL